MTSLFAIATEYRSAALKLADLDMDAQTISETLESMAGDLEVKAQSVAHMVRSIEADAAAVAQWGKDAAARAKALEARAESLREYLAQNLAACGIEKVEGPGVRISWRKSSAVVIDDPGLVPAEYMRQAAPPPPVPDKIAIRDALNAGNVVSGAHMEQRKTLQIV